METLSQEINLEKYLTLPESEIYLDPRPRIKNIVRELEEEHGWTWPPQPRKDWERSRQMKRRKWSCLYSKECLDISSILALIIGPWELLVALGFCILPKTFVPALRESSEFCIIFVVLFLFQGFKHTFVALLGLGLRSMHPYLIGFVHVSWPYETVWPLVGIFVSVVGFYTTQEWRVRREMTLHLKGYTGHWFSSSGWDRYQGFMRCCGIDSWKDWRDLGPLLLLQEKLATVPKSCCVLGEDCAHDVKPDENVHSWGCLQITTRSLDVIFVSGTICMVIGFILGILGYRSLREAEDCVGDPIHTLLFEGSSGSKNHEGGPTGIESKSLRRQELLSLLDHYCLLLGSEMGLNEQVKRAKEQMGLDPGEGSKPRRPPAPPQTGVGSRDGSFTGVTGVPGGRVSEVPEDTGGVTRANSMSNSAPRKSEPQDAEETPKLEKSMSVDVDIDELDALDTINVNAIPNPGRLNLSRSRDKRIPPQPLRLAPKLVPSTSTEGDAGKGVVAGAAHYMPPSTSEVKVKMDTSQPLTMITTNDMMVNNSTNPFLEDVGPGSSSEMVMDIIKILDNAVFGILDVVDDESVDKDNQMNNETNSEDKLNEPKPEIAHPSPAPAEPETEINIRDKDSNTNPTNF